MGRDDDVGGLDVAVNNAVSVRFGKRVGDLDGNVERLLRFEAAAFYFCRERFALDILHHDKAESALFPDLVDRADVRVLRAGGGWPPQKAAVECSSTAESWGSISGTGVRRVSRR